jgi:signal transduction histidine kinase
MRFFIACISGFVFFTTLYGQSHVNSSFNELIDHAKSVRDSLPTESKAFYLAAWKISTDIEATKRAWLLNEIGSLYHHAGYYDSSLFFHRKGLLTAMTVNHTEEEVGAYQGFAENFTSLSMRDSAQYYLEKAILLAKEKRLYAQEARAYSNLGNVYSQANNLKESLAHHIRAANIYDSLVHDPVGFSTSLSNIANVHNSLGNHDTALEYIRQSNPIAEEHSFFRGIAYNHRLAGRIYRQKKETEMALKEYQLARTMYKRSSDKFNMSEVSNNIGNLYYDLGEFHKALAEYKVSLGIAKQIGVKSLMAYDYSALGFAYYSLKEWKNASSYMDSSRILAFEINHSILLRDAYDVLAEIEKEQHQYKSALVYKEKYIAISDSLRAVENRKAIEEIEAKYQNDKKTAAIELLRKDQEIKEASIQRKEIIQTGTVVSLVAVIIIAGLLFNRFRLLNESKRQIEIERIRHQIARDLHDDIGSTLSSINIISQVALKEDKQSKLSTHFQHIYDHSGRIMENMADIVWSIQPGNDSMEKVVAKMKEFCGEILEPMDVAYYFENAELLSGMTLSIEARKNLFLIFKEIINNAAKYSGATTLNVRFSKNHTELTMDISDNGKGFDPRSATSGNGLPNIQKRAEAMHATLEFLGAPGKGTRIVLEVKGVT